MDSTIIKIFSQSHYISKSHSFSLSSCFNCFTGSIKVLVSFSKCFTNIFGVLPLKILKNYPSASKIASLNLDTSYDELTKGLRGSYSYQKYKNLINSAKNTIGKSNDIKEIELLTTITLIETLNEQIENIENEIETIMNQYNFKLLSIPGMGIQSAAVIVSEYSDFSLFKSPNQLLSFAGIEPSISQSGTQSFNGHMVKRGSPHLRYALMNVVMPIIANNKVF